MEFKPNKIIFHHTADIYAGNQFEKTNTYHKTIKFPKSSLGFFLGYHALIERSGEIRFARKYNEIGAHCLGQNDESIGICMAGNFDFETPTDEQKKSMGILCNDIMKILKIPITKIYPHRTFRQTSCPGRNVPDMFASYATIEQELNTIKKLVQILKISLQI